MSKIGLDLRLVKKISDDLWVHHEPVTYDVYRANWKILKQCSVDSLGGGMIDSALSANMLLFALNDFASKGCEKVYSLLNISDEEIEANHELSGNVEFKRCRAFINTIIQRTNAVTPLNGTYANLPLLDSRVKLSDEDIDKIIGNILFFTSWNYAGIPTRANLLNLIDCQESLLSCVEFQKSLQKSIVKESTKATKQAG
jgi:hypothetical protein